MSNTEYQVSVNLPSLMNQKQVAEYLGKSVKTLERDRWAGIGIPFVKVGRLVRYRADDVMEWLEKNCKRFD